MEMTQDKLKIEKTVYRKNLFGLSLLSLGVIFGNPDLFSQTISGIRPLSVQSGSISAVPTSCPNAPTYRFQPIGSPIPTTIDSTFTNLDLNNRSEVLATVYTYGYGQFGYVWNSRTRVFRDVREFTDIESFLYATHLNSRGDIAGYSLSLEANRRSATWQTTSGIVDTVEASEILSGLNSAEYRAINNHGMVAGVVSNPSAPIGFFSRDRNNFETIPALGADRSNVIAMNDQGTVVGELSFGAESRAFRFDPGIPTSITTTLPSLSGYERQAATAINNQGQILVNVQDQQGLLPSGYLLWQQGMTFNLNLLNSMRAAINNLGHIGGTDGNSWLAVVIKNNNRYTLQNHLSPQVNLQSFSIYAVHDINDHGEVLVKYAYRPTIGNPYGNLIYRYAVLQPNCQ